MLSVEELHVRYGRLVALRGISVEVKEGEVVGLIGPNGAGKTTTLGAIVGLLAPASGDITFEGHSLVGQTPDSIVRNGVALVPEGRRIFASLTVQENLLMGGTVRKRGSYAADLEGMVDRFPVLKPYLHSPAGKLSGGEQQQLAIARALLSEPRLLLLDEPSLGLAPMMVDLVFEVLDQLRGDGVTILLVEQNARRTLEFADRTYVLQTGSVVAETTRDTVLEQDSAAIEAAYLGF